MNSKGALVLSTATQFSCIFHWFFYTYFLNTGIYSIRYLDFLYYSVIVSGDLSLDRYLQRLQNAMHKLELRFIFQMLDLLNISTDVGSFPPYNWRWSMVKNSGFLRLLWISIRGTHLWTYSLWAWLVWISLTHWHFPPGNFAYVLVIK